MNIVNEYQGCKVLSLHNEFKHEDSKFILDSNMYDFFKDSELKWNNYGYLMVEYEGKLRPLHCVIYYLTFGVWSKQYETAIHHKNGFKIDNRIQNLEIIDWYSHRALHPAGRESNPAGLIVA